jgi:hypothetical protein
VHIESLLSQPQCNHVLHAQQLSHNNHTPPQQPPQRGPTWPKAMLLQSDGSPALCMPCVACSTCSGGLQRAISRRLGGGHAEGVVGGDKVVHSLLDLRLHQTFDEAVVPVGKRH